MVSETFFFFAFLLFFQQSWNCLQHSITIISLRHKILSQFFAFKFLIFCTCWMWIDSRVFIFKTRKVPMQKFRFVIVYLIQLFSCCFIDQNSCFITKSFSSFFFRKLHVCKDTDDKLTRLDRSALDTRLTFLALFKKLFHFPLSFQPVFYPPTVVVFV